MTIRKSKAIKTSSSSSYQSLLDKVKKTLIEGQRRIDQERVRTYWETGRHIHVYLLKYERAGRGEETIKHLSRDLGVSETVLHRCVKFVVKYPDLRKVATWPLFSWSHYRKLITIADDKKRLRLEAGVAQKSWTVHELTSRINEERTLREEQDRAMSATRSSIDSKPLTFLRGMLYTYRLVERPNLAADTESGLLVDLGFGIYHEVDPFDGVYTSSFRAGKKAPLRVNPEQSRKVDNRFLSGFSKDEIIESRPREDTYKFYKSERTAQDLFTYAAFVEKVIDGDTVKVRLDLGFNVWTRQVLRLRGIDCPEAGTSAGDEAKSFVRSHLKEAQQIIVRTSRSDKYDRYLADVFIPQGSDPSPQMDIYLNNLLLETGRARRAG